MNRGNFGISYSAKANRTFRADLTISDVCRACNNGPLSALDQYACRLYDAYFGKFVEKGEQIRFEYDFSPLLLWLLKVAYNSSRSTGRHEELLRLYAPALISPFPCSPVFAVSFVTTIAPSHYIQPPCADVQTMYPQGVRSGPIILPEANVPDWCHLRTVSINSYMFTLVLPERTRIDPTVMSNVLAAVPGVPLTPKGRSMLPSPEMETRDVFSGIKNWPRLRDDKPQK